MSYANVIKRIKKLESRLCMPGEQFRNRYYDELTDAERKEYLLLHEISEPELLEIEQFIQGTAEPTKHFLLSVADNGGISDRITAITEYITEYTNNG